MGGSKKMAHLYIATFSGEFPHENKKISRLTGTLKRR
jgi:hypothetical protein